MLIPRPPIVSLSLSPPPVLLWPPQVLEAKQATRMSSNDLHLISVPCKGSLQLTTLYPWGGVAQCCH